MFEQSSKTEKFNMNKNIKEKLNDIIYNNDEESNNKNQPELISDNEENLYDEKFN
jgi:hypothetical protein